jgi:hypothetical protein
MVASFFDYVTLNPAVLRGNFHEGYNRENYILRQAQNDTISHIQKFAKFSILDIIYRYSLFA